MHSDELPKGSGGRDDCLGRYCCSLNEKPCPRENHEGKRVGGEQLWDQDREHRRRGSPGNRGGPKEPRSVSPMPLPPLLSAPSRQHRASHINRGQLVPQWGMPAATPEPAPDTRGATSRLRPRYTVVAQSLHRKDFSQVNPERRGGDNLALRSTAPQCSGGKEDGSSKRSARVSAGSGPAHALHRRPRSLRIADVGPWEGDVMRPITGMRHWPATWQWQMPALSGLSGF